MSAAVIYLSSAVVYGAQRDAHEASPLHPCEVQAQSLVASEAMVAAAQVPALILRSSEIILDEASLALAHTRSEQQDLKQNTSILQTLANAILQQTKFTLAGSDYPTPDGTALYDLLPLSTFLKAIVASVTYLGQAQANGLHPPAIFNLGTGQSTSVRQMMMMAETLAQRPMAYHLGPRPSGGYGQIGLNPHKTQTTFGVALNAISLEAALRAAFQQAALNFSSPAIARP
jgi:UDP-glucose 4-epimerase